MTYTLEYVKNCIENDGSGDILLSDEYRGCYEKLEIKCYKCKKSYFMAFTNVLQGHKCPCDKYDRISKSQRKDINAVEEKFNELKLNLLDKNYINAKEKLLTQCQVCGHEWYTCYSYIKDGCGCPNCGKEKSIKTMRINTSKNDKSIKFLFPEISCEWDKNKNEGILPESFSPGSDKKVWWKCSFSECGYEWKATIASRCIGKSGCPACAGNVVSDKNRFSLLFPELLNEWDFSKNKINPNDVSYGVRTKFWWVCSECHYEWLAALYNRTLSENGCPNCYESRGEKEIRMCLNKYNIFYEREKWFSNCRNILPLPFDFGMPYDNGTWFLIEYHGLQHYEVLKNNWYGGKKELKERQYRDKLKYQYCKDNNIPLLIIPYWEFDNIEQILKETLL